MSFSKSIRSLAILVTFCFLSLTAASAQVGAWTWQGGSNIAGAAPTFGTGANPGARQTPAYWADWQGNLYIFGGYGVDASGTGYLNDLWKYSIASGQWTLVSGATPLNQKGHVVGAQGHSDPNNYPGSRYGMAFTIDSNWNLWLFGGYGYDTAGNVGYLGDLWEYESGSGEWIWWGGSTTANASSVYGAQGQSSTTFHPNALFSPAISVDLSGYVWVFGGYASPGTSDVVWRFNNYDLTWQWNNGSPYLFNLAPDFTHQNPGGMYEMSYWTTRFNGLFWFSSGYNAATGPTNSVWENKVLSNSTNWSSTQAESNGAGVYGTEGVGAFGDYPGARQGASVSLDDGYNVWFFGGYGYNANGDIEGYTNDLFELTSGYLYFQAYYWIWQGGSSNAYNLSGVYGQPGQGAPSNSPGSRQYAALWADTKGNIWLFGGTGYDSQGTNYLLNDLWEFHPNGIAATPVITPGSETFYVPVNVSISSTTPGATIYYTTDGSTPTTSSSVYSGPLSVVNTVNIKAIAVASGYANSATASATYTKGNFYWAPSTTTFPYGVALSNVPALLDATMSVPGNISYFIHGTPVNGATVLNVGQYQLDAIFTAPGGAQLDKISYKLTVTPATLTVTPGSVTVTYGSAVPHYTYGITGFVNGDASSVVTGVPTLFTSATSRATTTGAVVYTSNVGLYAINSTWGSLKAANYTFAFQSAPLVINPSPLYLTVQPFDDVITQGSPIPANFAYKVTGFLNWDNAANQLSGTAATYTNASNGSPHGYYTIYSGPGTLQQIYNNYAGINYNTATLTIH